MLVHVVAGPAWGETVGPGEGRPEPGKPAEPGGVRRGARGPRLRRGRAGRLVLLRPPGRLSAAGDGPRPEARPDGWNLGRGLLLRPESMARPGCRHPAAGGGHRPRLRAGGERGGRLSRRPSYRVL